MAGETNSTLIIDPTTLGDSGKTYSVQIDDDIESITSDSATLTVETPLLEIVSGPDDLTVTEGDDATFIVTTTGGSGTLSYQWLADNVVINDATDSILTIPGVTLDDSGTVYQIQVTDDGNTTVFASATLTVEEADINLVITAQPVDATVDEGDDASFSVTAVGDGPLSYQWFADGSAISGETTDTLVVSSCLLYTSPSPRDRQKSRMPSSA